MTQFKIEQSSSPNFKPGRNHRKPIAIVDHITGGLMPGTLSWLRNPKAKVSAHYLVTKTGCIIQLVKDEDTAYAVGIVNKPNWPYYDGTNPNNYTLSIEHEALAGEKLTEEQYQATLWLHKLLIARWNIPVDREHIIGHYRLDSVNRKHDPGAGFPWERLFTDLSSPVTPPSPETKPVNIRVGKTLINGTLVGNLAYAPVRQLAEALGRTVEWHEDTQCVVIPPALPLDSPGQQVMIVVGNSRLPALMENDHALAPVREFAETLGYKVSWNQATNTVNIV